VPQKLIYILFSLAFFIKGFSQKTDISHLNYSDSTLYFVSDLSILHRQTPAFADSSYPNKTRLWLVGGIQAGLWVGSFLALNQFWYTDYPRSSFHFFNDNKEWNQMDKLGHVFTTFQVSNISSKMWKWAGLSHKKAVLYGAVNGIAYQSIIEIQDAYSAEWGFSVADMGSNILGAAVFVAQELTWEEKRIRLKLSFSNHDYPKEVRPRYEQLFGSSFVERYLKDYNSQTYWVSVNPRSFFINSKFPAWLNIAVGYGSDLMLGGIENTWTDKQGVFFDRRDLPRIRRFYFSPDIDFTRIPTNSKLLKTVFMLMGGIKMPAPTLELNSQGKLKAHLLYF
jgi:VanZ family protein